MKKALLAVACVLIFTGGSYHPNPGVPYIGAGQDVDLGLHELTAAAVTVTNDIVVGGTVDGIDVAAVSTEFRGAIKETISISLDASGANIVFSLEANGGGDLSLMTALGFVVFDSTPAATINLTAGTATVPAENYIFINDSQVLTTDTNWPSTEHWPIARIIVLTRVLTDTNGPLKVHAYTDHFANGATGHISHMSKKIRELNATYESGVALTTVPALSGSGATVSGSTTQGVIFQMHPHTMPALDSAVDGIFVPNHPTPYTHVTNLGTLLTDADSGSLTNKHYALVIWGVVSENESECQLFCNLPTGSYNTQSAAIVDADRHTVYAIPTVYTGTAFLIARLVLKNTTDSSFTMNAIEDLRGLVASTSPGGGAGITSHASLTDLVWSTAAHTMDDGLDMNSNTISEVSGLTVDDGGTIGSVSDDDALTIEADGDCVFSQDLSVTGTLSGMTSLNINSSTTVDGIIDDDSMATASATTLATSESVVAYVDANASAPDEQEFASTGAFTWTKPGGGTTALIEIWGAGGSGGQAGTTDGAGGGGGGGYVRFLVRVDSLSATEPVTVGAGGALQSSENDGVAGGNSSFAGIISYGGGGGGGTTAMEAGGGGGGDANAAGGDGGDGSAGAGGGAGGGDGGAVDGNAGGVGVAQADWSEGGGGGGGGQAAGAPGAGGATRYAGGGGESGSGNTSGSGGAASTFGGNGGNGATGVSAATAGAQPGGGGGGSETGNSGAGGNGLVRITTW